MAFTHPCVLCSGLLVIAASSQHTCFVVVVVVWCVMYDWCKMKTMFGVRDSTRPGRIRKRCSVFPVFFKFGTKLLGETLDTTVLLVHCVKACVAHACPGADKYPKPRVDHQVCPSP